MPINQFGDQYADEQYNGDSTYNGRVNTKQMSREEKGINYFNDVFVTKVLPNYSPNIKDWFESFNSAELEPGEYIIEQDTSQNGVMVFLEAAVPPEDYVRLMNMSYEELSAPFVNSAPDGASTEILSNDDNYTLTFQLTL